MRRCFSTNSKELRRSNRNSRRITHTHVIDTISCLGINVFKFLAGDQLLTGIDLLESDTAISFRRITHSFGLVTLIDGIAEGAILLMYVESLAFIMDGTNNALSKYEIFGTKHVYPLAFSG